jgi:hypothetical protein
MKSAKLSVPGGLLGTMYEMVVILLGAWLHAIPLALAAVTAAELYRAYRRHALSVPGLAAESPVWLVGLSAGLFIGLQSNQLTQVVLVCVYGAWRWWLLKRYRTAEHLMVIASVSEVAGLAAVFLAAAVWHWPVIVTVVLTWAISWLVGHHLLAEAGDRAAPVLVAAWALVAAECAWLFSLWLVTYIVWDGIVLLPQAALVISALGYCLGGIYFSHRSNHLSRARLVEYLVVGLVLLIFVIVGTKWNSAI